MIYGLASRLRRSTRLVEALIVVGFGVALAIVLRGLDASTAAPGAEPFVTYDNMLQVTFTVFPDQPPVVSAVRTLPSGRITVLSPGANHLRIEAADGSILYQQPFDAVFLRYSHPPVDLDHLDMLVVVPNLDGARRIVVVTPQGEASYELSDQ